MMTTKILFRTGLAVSATALVVMTTASCTSLRHSSPEQVETSAPSVTYEYRGDDELIQANQRAVTYCNAYNGIPQPAKFSNGTDGSKVVIFDCVQAAQLAQPVQQLSPTLGYKYRSDQELFDLSRNAQLYCLNNGSQQTDASVVRNPDGSRSVTFHCTQ